MRASKFAPITASLLARKGEARPWSEPNAYQDNEWRSAEPAIVTPLRIVDNDDGDGGRDKRVSLRMTSEDYAALGMLAARQGSTRQKFLYAVLRRILDGASIGPVFGL